MNLAGVVLMALITALLTAENKTTVLVRVGKTNITRGDVDFAATVRELKPAELGDKERELINELIDQQIIREFLAKKKVDAPAEELQFQIGKAQEAIKRQGQGEDPALFLAKIGYTQDRLKRELGLPLAWQAYARKTITPDQIKDYYKRHKEELDGTQVRASQIFLKVPKDLGRSAALEQTRDKLLSIRGQIESGSISFAEAAKKYSEAPTAENGGDVGLFGWHGKMTFAVTQRAFAMKVGEISSPVQSNHGFHLILLTERHEGDLSIEDVRPQIMDQLAQELWKTVLAEEKQSTKVEWKSKKQ